MMLCVYPADCTDFSNNGMGLISPSSAIVKETLNGSYELKIIHSFMETPVYMIIKMKKPAA